MAEKRENEVAKITGLVQNVSAKSHLGRHQRVYSLVPSVLSVDHELEPSVQGGRVVY